MRLGSLFSGAGLGDLGWLMAGFEIVWQVEIDKYCQQILERRFPESKKYYDIKTFKGEKGSVDIVAGGFPCQPFSVAGNQRGDKDNRNLWPEMFRVIKKIRPTWVVGENVSGIIPIYLDTVLADLESEGYSCRTFVFPAHSLGASHRRERIWIVAKSSGERRNDGCNNREERQVLHDKIRNAEKDKPEGCGRECGIGEVSSDVADTGQQHGERDAKGVEANKAERSDSVIHTKSSCQRQPFPNTMSTGLEGSEKAGNLKKSRKNENKLFTRCDSIRNYWSTEPSICRVVNGCPSRVDRLKALGNGQVMACTAFIGQQIMEFERIR